jgi:hypothetical protein
MYGELKCMSHEVVTLIFKVQSEVLNKSPYTSGRVAGVQPKFELGTSRIEARLIAVFLVYVLYVYKRFRKGLIYFNYDSVIIK